MSLLDGRRQNAFFLLEVAGLLALFVRDNLDVSALGGEHSAK
jgi:hypothetical protein